MKKISKKILRNRKMASRSTNRIIDGVLTESARGQARSWKNRGLGKMGAASPVKIIMKDGKLVE